MQSQLLQTVPDESVLLLDETVIEEEHGIRREVQVGRKSQVLLEGDEENYWESGGPGLSNRLHLYGTVLYDDLMGKYRMWYFCRMGPHWRFEGANHQIPELYVPRTDAKPYNCNGVTEDKYGRPFADNDRGDLTCYAESDDGLRWEKPSVGRFAFNGSKDNNIVWDLHGASVFIDKEDPDLGRRYKAIGFCRRYRNIFMLTSPDGIYWEDKDNLEPVSERANEGSFNVTFDHKAGLYRAYSLSRFGDREKRRVICYTESPRLEGPWKASTPMLEPTHWDDEIAHRRHSALRAEFHNMSGFRYGNVHLGLLGVLSVTAEQIPDEPNQMPCDGPVESQFVDSRDGISWAHADRERTVAIPRGEPGSFDGGMIMGVAKEPVIEGDQVHWYYTGCEHTHGETSLEKRVKRIARATWDKDRFVALKANGKGTVMTRPFRLTEEIVGLDVNIDAGQGEARFELCDQQGRPLAGFHKSDCRTVSEDGLSIRLSWRNRSLPDVCRLHVELDKARIFSFTWRLS